MITNPIEQIRASSRVSESYNFISTQEIVNLVEAEGFHLHRKKIQNVYNPGRLGFQKHFLVFNKTMPEFRSSQDIAPQIIITNGHDGTSAFKIRFGIYRFICSNGLVVGTNLVPAFTIRHNSIDATNEKIVRGVHEIVSSGKLVAEKIDVMRNRQLSEDEKEMFEDAARILAFGRDNRTNLLEFRRTGDNSKDLWTVFNVAQENIITGGQNAINSAGRRTRTRNINSIDRLVKVNSELFDLALKYAA